MGFTRTSSVDEHPQYGESPGKHRVVPIEARVTDTAKIHSAARRTPM
jgi:hypothetical protein